METPDDNIEVTPCLKYFVLITTDVIRPDCLLFYEELALHCQSLDMYIYLHNNIFMKFSYCF